MKVSLNQIELSIILISYNNARKFQTRLERDIVPTITAHPKWNFKVIIIDNSDRPNELKLNALQEINLIPVYVWPGTNMMYGPAMNLAISLNPHPYTVYVCSNHGRMYNTSWIDDLITPIAESPKVVMTGSLYNSCQPTAMGFPKHLPAKHIQGGIFCARTEIIKKYPYTNDERWVHWGSDVYQSFQLMNAGFLLCEVPTIKSVWRQRIKSVGNWKYIHDNSEE